MTVLVTSSNLHKNQTQHNKNYIKMEDILHAKSEKQKSKESKEWFK